MHNVSRDIAIAIDRGRIGAPFSFAGPTDINSAPFAFSDTETHAMTPAKSKQDAPVRRRGPARPRPSLQVRSFPPEMPANAWLNLTDVLTFVPVSRTVWFRGVKNGLFPKPHKIGRLAFWKARDIRYLLDMGPRRARERVHAPRMKAQVVPVLLPRDPSA